MRYCNIQGVFHRLGVGGRDSQGLGRGDGGFRLSRGLAMPTCGMGLDVESSGAGAGLSPGFWFLLWNWGG